MTLDLEKEKANIFIAAMPISESQQTIIQTIHQHENSLKTNLDLKWTPPIDLHVTLGYLRDIKTEDIEAVIQKFEVIETYQAIMTTVVGAKVYGNAISLTLEPQAVFKSIHDQLSEALSELFEDKYHFSQHNRFQAHMTIGRVKTQSRKVPSHEKDMLTKWARDVFNDYEFTILEAMMLHRAPSNEKNYECLRRYPLKS